MISFSTSEWAILALVFLLGWVLGLMSRRGGGRWRRELEIERRAREDDRRAYEARLADVDRRPHSRV
jgi:hypothetical protein